MTYERFDAKRAAREDDAMAAQMLVKALAIGRTLGGARSVARALPFAGYDADALLTAALPGSVRKAAVSTTTFPADAGPLVYLLGRIVEQSVLGRLTRAKRIPFRRAAGAQVVASAAGFRAEGAAIKVVRSEFDDVVHDPYSVAAITVVSREGLADQPNGERMLRDDLIAAAAEAIDARFASAEAATSAAPAGIREDAIAVASTGITPAAIATDLSGMVDQLASYVAPVWLMSAKAAAYLRLHRIVADDGTLAGWPLYASAGIEGLALVASDRVALSLSDQASLTVSDHASVEMSDDPESDTGTVLSMFQLDLTALRLAAYCDWTLVAPSVSAGSRGVIELTGAAYV